MSDPAEMRMFDLGLAKGMEIAEERIIKLLQSDEAYGAFWLEYNSLVIKNTLDRLIALIQGEK